MNTITASQILYNEDLSSKAKAVFQYLAFRSNKENTCFPALKTIAKDCSISVSSVQRGIRELLDAGWIQKKHNYRENGSQTSNTYELIIAVGERILAAKENAQQRLQEMRRWLKYKEAKKEQLEMNLDTVRKVKNERRSHPAKEKNAVASFIKMLKFKHLTRGDSHKDYPRTLTD